MTDRALPHSAGALHAEYAILPASGSAKPRFSALQKGLGGRHEAGVRSCTH